MGLHRSVATVAAAALFATGGAARAEQARFSLSMFHFNVQYVAGGLVGFPDGETFEPTFDLDDAAVQDLIVRESLLPILELLERHSSWTLTIEMQAYMVEVMLDRHPETLDLLRRLVDAGQVELVSFHYSDQLFLAYPRLDLERSHDLMEEVWAEAEIAPSAVVFCQEGQFGVGMAAFGEPRGRTIFALPKNLFRYQHGEADETTPLLFDLEGSTVILAGRGFSSPEVEVTWSFFDDGELLATGGKNPYVGAGFLREDPALAEYETGLEGLEAAGFHIASIGELVAWADENGIGREPLPPMLDGTWQPASTDSMWRWMGASGLYDVLLETQRDNEVLTGNVRARHRILGAETLVRDLAASGLVDAAPYDERIMGCWREVLLAEVSDATGINPFINEVRYGLDHGLAAYACADSVLAELAPLAGDRYVEIDTLRGEVTAKDAPREEQERAEEPFFGDDLEVSAPGRTVEVTWAAVGASGTTHRVRIDVSPAEGDERELEVAFPLALDGFAVTPALVEDRAPLLPFDAFELEDGRISLPVANGLVGLDEGLWLVEQTDSVHVAATFVMGEPFVRFRDHTLPAAQGTSWTFHVLEGSEQEAVALAQRLNLAPTIELSLVEDEGADCGCRAAGPARTSGGRALLRALFP
jgi:hypothetical protein